MDISAAINVLQSYPYCDIEKRDGTLLRKQVSTSEISEALLKSYATLNGDIRVIPKRLMGKAPLRIESEAILIPSSPEPPMYQQQPLLGLSGVGAQFSSTSNEMYKILYEKECKEKDDYRKRYEDTLSELRKLEVEHAGSKGSLMGDIAQGLAGVAPFIMGGKGGGALGEAPAASAPAQPQMTKVQDKRLVNIINYFSRLEEEGKAAFYNLFAKATERRENVSKAIEVLSGLEDSEVEES